MMSAETGKQMSPGRCSGRGGAGYVGLATKGTRTVLAGDVFCLAEKPSHHAGWDAEPLPFSRLLGGEQRHRKPCYFFNCEFSVT